LENEVTVDQQTLFRTSIEMPSNLTEGHYDTRILLTRNGVVISTLNTEIDVRKVGLERFLFSLSREQPLVYGLLSLAIAIFAGWGASGLFSALRRSYHESSSCPDPPLHIVPILNFFQVCQPVGWTMTNMAI
jgi:hypothetical protein